MFEIFVTVVIYLAGAITEYESKGSVTKAIMYQEDNSTICECKNL